MDHRVEPPSWLPQEAAPQAADPKGDEASASDASALQDDSAPAQSTDELASGNGHDGSYTYTRDDSYSYAQGSPQVADGPQVAGGPQAAGDLAEGTQAARGPFEEALKPPFHELPSAGFDPPPAPPPPGDELTGSGFVTSAASVGLPDSDLDGSGTDASPADDGLSKDEFSRNGAAASLPDGDSGDGAAAADPADNGLAGDETLATPYAPEFPPAPAPVVTAGPETSAGAQQAGSTYAFVPPPPPPTPPLPPPPTKGRQAPAQARRANLIVARLEPWSVMKFSFLISLVAWIVLFVAVALLYYALSSLGVFGALQKTLAGVTSSQGSSGVDLGKWTSATRILGYTMLIGAVDVVLITALSTLGAVVYNLVTHLGGGIEITLKETE